MLPPAHYLVATPESVDTVRYWRMEDTPDIRLGADRDYVELLLETYGEAVRSRLRAIRPVATTLSGGLDSSSVTALVARELRACGRRLQAYTWVPGYDAGPSHDKRVTDEGPLADDLARIAGNVDVHRITGNVDPVAAIKRMIDVEAAPVVAPSNAAWVDETLRAVVDHGAGSLLTGIFGNATVSWAGLGSQSWREDGRAFGWPAAARGVVRPLLPAVAGRMYRRIRDGRRGSQIMWPLRYAPIGRDFARRLDLERRLDESTEYQALFRIPADSRAARLQILFPDSLTTGAHWAALEARYGVSFSAPTIDKRVLELCLGIPDRVFSARDRQRRWLIREAMRGLVPDSIRLNPYRGAQGADLLPRLRAYGGSIEAALAENDAVPLVRELVDMPRIRSAWEMVKNSQGPEAWSVAVHTLLNGLQAAIFLAAEFGR
jgi:asparagine synthase (glutamine-hydrolysing)